MKTCTGCNRKLTLEEFQRQRARRDGRMSRCKSCVSKAPTTKLVSSGYNQKVYSDTLKMFQQRFGV